MKIVRIVPWGATHAVKFDGTSRWNLSAATACGQLFPAKWVTRWAVSFGLSRGLVRTDVGCRACKRTTWWKERYPK